MPKFSKKFGYRPDLPNVGSRFQTPSTLLIDVHYNKLLLVERWTWERFIRLCAFLQISEGELASAVLMPHQYLGPYETSNHIHHSRARAAPIALLLTLLEHHCCGAMTKDTIENPFPNLNPRA